MVTVSQKLVLLVFLPAAAWAGTSTWLTAAGGLWSTASNWNPGVPGPDDSAVVPSGITGPITATDAVNITSLTLSHTGTVTFGASSTVGSLTQNAANTFVFAGGVLSIDGQLRVSGTSAIFSLINGSTAVVNSVYLTASSGNGIRINSSPAPSVLNVTTYFQWSGSAALSDQQVLGLGQLNILADATALITGTGSAMNLYVAFNVFGTVTYSCTSYGVRTYSGGFRNFNQFIASGTSSQVVIQQITAGGVFVNYGNLTVDAPSNFYLPNSLEQRGTVWVKNGQLRLGGGGVAYAGSTMTHDPGAGIAFEGGTFQLLQGATLAAGDGIAFKGGSFLVAGNFLPTVWTHSNAIINFTAGPYSFPTVTQNSGGTVNWLSDVTIGTYYMQGSSTSALAFYPGVRATIDMLYLTGSSGNTVQLYGAGVPAELNITTRLEWGGGNAIGDSNALGLSRLNLLPTATALLSGSATTMYLYAQFNNYGVVTYQCTGSYGMRTYTGQIRNYNLFLVTGVASSVMVYATARNFVNYGTMTIDVQTDFRMTNYLEQWGTVTVSKGLLRLAGGGIAYANSTMSHVPGAGIQFEGGVFQLGLGATLADGAGITFQAGTISIAGNFLPTSWTHSGAAMINFTAGPYSFPTVTQNSGGTVNWMSDVTIGTYYMQGSATATLTFHPGVRASIGSVYLTGTSSTMNLYSLPSPAAVNISSWFEWTNTAAIGDPNSQAAGQLSVLSTASGVIYGSASTMTLTAQLINYGNLTYSCTGTYGMRT